MRTDEEPMKARKHIHAHQNKPAMTQRSYDAFVVAVVVIVVDSKALTLLVV